VPEFGKMRGRARRNPKEQIQEEEEESYISRSAMTGAGGGRSSAWVGARWGVVRSWPSDLLAGVGELGRGTVS